MWALPNKKLVKTTNQPTTGTVMKSNQITKFSLENIPGKMNWENIPSLKYSENNFNFFLKPDFSLEFDKLLHDLWQKKVFDNCFRYQLGDLKTKYLPGKYSFVAQLNVKRAVERRKPQFISSIAMPFNPEIFHFGKVSEKEVLFTLHPQHWTAGTSENKTDNSNHALVINVSPIEECNSLLLPFVDKCLPQMITEDGLRLAVEMFLTSSDRSLRMGFNSLGAYASVNHFHFHLYYLRYKLHLEDVPVNHLMEHCYELLSFPSQGFAFQVQNPAEIVTVVKSAMKLINFLQKKEIPHNLFMTRGNAFSEDDPSHLGKSSVLRIFVWARKAVYGSKNDISFNPAVCELAGHIIVKETDGFDIISEDYVAGILRDACYSTFLNIREDVKHLFCSA